MAKKFDTDKPADKKISKKVKSANRRSQRKASCPRGENFNKRNCPECGFRIRGVNHADGDQHIQHKTTDKGRA